MCVSACRHVHMHLHPCLYVGHEFVDVRSAFSFPSCKLLGPGLAASAFTHRDFALTPHVPFLKHQNILSGIIPFYTLALQRYDTFRFWRCSKINPHMHTWKAHRIKFWGNRWPPKVSQWQPVSSCYTPRSCLRKWLLPFSSDILCHWISLRDFLCHLQQKL